jgi:Ca-activated chloride channel family protein
MTFAFPPALLIAAVLIPLSIALFAWKSRWTRRQLSAVVAPRLREQLTATIDWGKRRAKAVLFVAGLLFMLIAIARPQYGFKSAEVDRNSVDFLIALDLSRSMYVEDMGGRQRLGEAKEAIGLLLDVLGGGDRVGLIGFAGEAFVAAPVTFDHEAVRRTLNNLDPRVVERAGSDIASAIRLADRTFAAGDYETKALVVITDGEELQGDAVIAGREAARSGLRIYTVGVGTASGGRIPEKDARGTVRYVRNEFGTEVISRMNHRMLQQVAASGRGRFEAIGIRGEGLRNIYENSVRPLGTGMRQKPSKDPGEYFQWPLGLAVALFLVELLLNERRKLPLLRP